MQIHTLQTAPRTRHRSGRRFVTLCACAILCAAARPAAAAFVGGVEQFNGTTKDSVTWDEFNNFMSDNAITQNDAINFQYVPPPNQFPGAVNSDYTARTDTVGVGQAASVDVRLRAVTRPAGAPFFPLHVSFYLTDNTGGPGTSSRTDDNFVELILDPGTTDAARVGRGGNGGSHGIGRNIPGPFPFMPGSQYTLQIARPDLDTARFSVFDAAGNLLGSETADVTGLPATLYPAFGVSGFNIPAGADYSIDFDNVRIVPEPATVALLAVLGTPLLLARRRRLSRR
jgi:hypothetical protein